MSMFNMLAENFPQLYLEPGDEGEKLYPEVVLRGRLPENRSLIHFIGSADDDCHMEETPAGKVRVVTLGNRRDFETFLQIMGYRCAPVSIPPTQGALFIDGVINRKSIIWHKEALIVLSVGPYSGIPAEKIRSLHAEDTTTENMNDGLKDYGGISDEEWLKLSHRIRLTHECTHFVCRRLFPDQINAVHDELAADAAGIYSATGRFDRSLAELFLGIRQGAYVGGRLGNYTDDPGALMQDVDEILTKLESVAKEYAGIPPLELAIRFEEAVL